MINGYIHIFVVILGGVLGFVVASVTVVYIFKFDRILKEHQVNKEIKRKEAKKKKSNGNVDEIKNRLSNRSQSWVEMNQSLDGVDEEAAKEYAAQKRKDLDKSYKYAKR